MTSLEFIEKEIEDSKEILNRAIRNNLAVGIINEQEKIQHLEQIKFEIEAWYSIKQGIKLCEGKMYEDSYYEYLQFEEKLFDESESEEASERLIPIKKLLEVRE